MSSFIYATTRESWLESLAITVCVARPAIYLFVVQTTIGLPRLSGVS